MYGFGGNYEAETIMRHILVLGCDDLAVKTLQTNDGSDSHVWHER